MSKSTRKPDAPKTSSSAKKILDDLIGGFLCVEPVWANFEKLLPILPDGLRFRANLEVTAAFREPLYAYRVLVALKFLEQFQRTAIPCTTPNEVARVPSGRLFIYVGDAMSCEGLHFPLDAEDANVLSTFAIGSPIDGDRCEGHARLSHSLVVSVNNLEEEGAKLLLASKVLGNAFLPLLAGQVVVSMDRESAYDGPGFGFISQTDRENMTPTKFVDRIIERTKGEIENRHAWKLVEREHSDRAAQELDFQYLFEFLSFSLAQDYDISVDPQADHGVGRLDICYSRGATNSCCVELKMSTHDDLLGGLNLQLPAYMSAKNSSSGRYVVYCSEYGMSPELVVERLGDPPGGIEIVAIDGRPRPTASML